MFDRVLNSAAHLGRPSLRRLGAITYISVRGVSRSFPDAPGAPLHWRQNADLSGLNILTMGIFYEALQRYACCLVAAVHSTLRCMLNHASVWGQGAVQAWPAHDRCRALLLDAAAPGQPRCSRDQLCTARSRGHLALRGLPLHA